MTQKNTCIELSVGACVHIHMSYEAESVCRDTVQCNLDLHFHDYCFFSRAAEVVQSAARLRHLLPLKSIGAQF